MTRKFLLPLFIIAIVMTILLTPASVQAGAGYNCDYLPKAYVLINTPYPVPGWPIPEVTFPSKVAADAWARQQPNGACIYVWNNSALLENYFIPGPYSPDTGVPLSPEATYSLIASLAILLLAGGWWLRRRSTQLMPTA